MGGPTEPILTQQSQIRWMFKLAITCYTALAVVAAISSVVTLVDDTQGTNHTSLYDDASMQQRLVF